VKLPQQKPRADSRLL